MILQKLSDNPETHDLQDADCHSVFMVCRVYAFGQILRAQTKACKRLRPCGSCNGLLLTEIGKLAVSKHVLQTSGRNIHESIEAQVSYTIFDPKNGTLQTTISQNSKPLVHFKFECLQFVLFEKRHE
jgi:hypothetical protein